MQVGQKRDSRQITPIPYLRPMQHREIFIRTTDRHIDDMVFDLYGLTAEERELVLGEANERKTDKT